jgi:hypothetical protein
VFRDQSEGILLDEVGGPVERVEGNAGLEYAKEQLAVALSYREQL